MTGTPSRTARVPTARWDLKEAAGKALARGTRTAYKASMRWARGPKDPKPVSHPERVDVYAAGRWSEGHAPYPGRSAFSPNGLDALRGASMKAQKSAAAIVETADRLEGPNESGALSAPFSWVVELQK